MPDRIVAMLLREWRQAERDLEVAHPGDRDDLQRRVDSLRTGYHEAARALALLQAGGAADQPRPATSDEILDMVTRQIAGATVIRRASGIPALRRPVDTNSLPWHRERGRVIDTQCQTATGTDQDSSSGDGGQRHADGSDQPATHSPDQAPVRGPQPNGSPAVCGPS
jgi:hypothetical protein